MWRHLEFDNCSNPYISMNDDNFMRWAFNWDLELVQLGPVPCYRVHEVTKPARTYWQCKAVVEQLAIDWQYNVGNSGYQLSYDEFAEWADFFEDYGRRYGLLREFRENAIC